MPTKIIRQPEHIAALATILESRKFPMTVSWSQGASQADAQNRLAQRWYSDVARQLGDQTHENVRAECKVRFGVPILSASSDAFRKGWQTGFGHLTYEATVETVEALDIPVTRLMLLDQMTAYMTAVRKEFTDQGLYLTDPEALKYEQEFQ